MDKSGAFTELDISSKDVWIFYDLEKARTEVSEINKHPEMYLIFNHKVKIVPLQITEVED